MVSNLLLLSIVLNAVCVAQCKGIRNADKSSTRRGNSLVTSCPIHEMYRPENGNMAIKSVKVGSKADFNCLEGFVLVGQAISTCLPSGKWSSKTPWCRPICEYTSCPEGTKCHYDYKDKAAVCVCKTTYDCPLAYEPVCGTDGRTFTSNCTLATTACQQENVESLFNENGPCREKDISTACPMCPRMKTCQAFYASNFAFIGKVTKRSKAREASLEDIHIYIDEVFKGYAYVKAHQRTTIKLQLRDDHCTCVPALSKGRVLVMGRSIIRAQNGFEVPLIDELTIIEKYYSPKQMSPCWLY